MNSILDELKVRHHEAGKAFQLAQAELQASQNRFNIASQRLNALAVVLRDEQQRVAQEEVAEAARQHKFAMAVSDANITASTPSPSPAAPQTAAPETTATNEPEAPNKTDLIRAVLGQHQKGISSSELWKELKDPQISSAYVHSVLHRLKKRGQVSRRLGKYFLKVPQPEEVAAQNGVVDVT